tara:strand:- start:1639 stop:2010 length:372 start_codon:yes stop_codon:yes gene_type:complete
MIIGLPIPDRRLGGNTRAHHMVLHRIRKEHKLLAAAATRQAMRLLEGQDRNYSGYSLEFFYAVKRRRDVDNLVFATKAYLDGVSAALGQDDSAWDLLGARIRVDKDVHPRMEIQMKRKHEHTV